MGINKFFDGMDFVELFVKQNWVAIKMIEQLGVYRVKKKGVQYKFYVSLFKFLFAFCPFTFEEGETVFLRIFCLFLICEIYLESSENI